MQAEKKDSLAPHKIPLIKATESIKSKIVTKTNFQVQAFAK